MAKSDQVAERLIASRDAGLYPYNLPLERIDETHIRLDGETLLMVSSYDYFSLITDARIAEAATLAIAKSGTSMGGVRLLTGSSPEHTALEARLAGIYGTQDCVTFSSGYFSNMGAMSLWGGPRTLAHVDALAHRSILDACKLVRSPIRRFRHNDCADLTRRLKRVCGEPGVVFVESLYSMDGDICDIDECSKVALKARLPMLVDDAHGLGLVAPNKSAPISAWVGSLSKAVPSSGGFIATDAQSADRIRHLAGPYIFSAAAAPSAVAAAEKALSIITEELWRREQLRENIDFFNAELGREFGGHDHRSPIIPIRYDCDEHALLAAQWLRRASIFATPIVSPAVGPNQPRLRICINLAHEREDLRRLATALKEFDRFHGIERRNQDLTVSMSANRCGV